MALPNWNLLLAFEAVARHGSFSLAAAELNVLQPAVSRRVAELERELGVRLVNRTRPRVTPTEAGTVLLAVIAESDRRLHGAIAQIRRSHGSRNLVVNTTIGFATCYLMRRLGGFRAAHPEIEVELVSRDLNDGYREDAVDIVIAFDSPERLPGERQVLVFPEKMIAVSARAAGSGGTPTPQTLEALVNGRIIHLWAGVHKKDWSVYLDGTGIALPPAKLSDRYTSFMVYLQAALDGEGTIIGWEHLLHDDLVAGRLQRAVDRVVETKRGYFACITRKGLANPASRAFADWLAQTPPAALAPAQR